MEDETLDGVFGYASLIFAALCWMKLIAADKQQEYLKFDPTIGCL